MLVSEEFTDKMEQKFKVGDQVVHKSGGPKMVIKGYEPKNGEEVVCEWFDKEHRVQERAFHQDTLNMHEPFVYITGKSRRENRW